VPCRRAWRSGRAWPARHGCCKASWAATPSQLHLWGLYGNCETRANRRPGRRLAPLVAGAIALISAQILLAPLIEP
jgi:hypothetical protein